MVELSALEIFFPHGEPAPCPGNTTHSLFNYLIFWRLSNKWSVRSLTEIFLAESLAKSGLPASPQNKVSPVKINSSCYLGPKIIHIDSKVWPGVCMNLKTVFPRGIS